MGKSNLHSVATIFVAITVLTIFGKYTEALSGRRAATGSDGRRGDVGDLPQWNAAPPSRFTHRNEGDTEDIDPRGSVRYNIGPDGRILRGIITKHREVPIDDNGTGIFQAKEESDFQDSYY